MKFFILFLLFTGLLAVVTAVILGCLMFTCIEQMNDPNQFAIGFIAKLNFTYACIIALCLISFFLYQVCSLGMKNTTSNEDIRHRWNGHHRNKKTVKQFKKEAGCCGRLRYILCGDMDYYHGKSKLELYAEWVELSFSDKKSEDSEGMLD